MAIEEVTVDSEGACGAPVAKLIVGMNNTAFYDAQNPKSPKFDPDFPKFFRRTPTSRGRIYLVRELREYNLIKAAARVNGGGAK